MIAVLDDLVLSPTFSIGPPLTRRSRNQEFLIDRVACLNRHLLRPTPRKSNC